MCIMEIHPRQHTTTMVQAMAHNTRTILSDCDMLHTVINTRECPSEYPDTLARATSELNNAYTDFMLLYARCLSDAVQVDKVVGSERQAADVRNAARYETR
jgi:hypothetical protein